MTEREMKEIRMVKGSQFTMIFVINFEKEWGNVTKMIKKSGVDLSIPIVRR